MYTYHERSGDVKHYGHQHMSIQIIGTKKCRRTRAADRFFRDRGIEYHFVDLTVRPLSAGELNNIASALGVDALIDVESKEYIKRGMAYMEFDPLEELAEHPMLLKTPVVRSGLRATVGESPETWQDWIESERT